MSRRSERICEAIGKGKGIHQNGNLSLWKGNKKMRLDEENFSQSLTNNIKKENHKALSPKTSLKDVPLRERRKITEQSDIIDNSKIDGLESINESSRDFGVDNKASTSHTCTENIATGFDFTSTDGKSLAVILSQGLTSRDAEKIDAVLSKTDMQTISTTLNDLPVTQVVDLLKEIEYRCRNRRHFDSCWMRWLQCILSKHMAYLCTISTLKDDLSSLFGWFSKRTSNMDELLQVCGKLSLINEQINRRMCPEMFITQQPTISFEDDGDVLSEASGEMNDFDDEEESIGSVEDWWNDEEVGSDESGLSSGEDDEVSKGDANSEDPDEDTDVDDDDDDGSGDGSDNDENDGANNEMEVE